MAIQTPHRPVVVRPLGETIGDDDDPPTHHVVADNRITEESDNRITEDGELRIMES